MCGSPCLPPILGTGLSSENHTSFSLTGILRHHRVRHPFAKGALTLHLARGEGHKRYFDCNLMHRKVLASSHQHLMAEAPGVEDEFAGRRSHGCLPVDTRSFFSDHKRITRTRTGRRPVVFRSILISIRPSRKGTLSSGRRRTFGCRRPQGRPTQARCHPCEDWAGGCAVDPRQYCRRFEKNES